MIRQIVLLSCGAGDTVSQQVVNGKYLVLNAPWSSSGCNVKVRMHGGEVVIESKDIVCRVLNGKITRLESVYPIDENIRFVETAPPSSSCDYFLAKRLFLRQLSKNRFSGDGTAHLRRRRIMRLVSPVLLYVFRSAVEHVLIDIPRQATALITSQDSVFQGPAIKMALGLLVEGFCSFQRIVFRLGEPVVFVNSLYLLPAKTCISVFSLMYSALVASFAEVIHLLNNSSHNPLKNRRDAIILSTDQIFMSVLIFSFCLLMIINVMGFHIFFAIARLFILCLEFAENFVDFLLTDTSACSTYDIVFSEGELHGVGFRCRGVSISEKILFALEASFLASELSKDRFLFKLLFGRLKCNLLN